MHTLKGLKPQNWREWGYNMTLANNICPESDLKEWSQWSEAAVVTEEDAVPLDRGGSGGAAGGIGDSAEDARKKQAEFQERVQESECEGDRDASVPYLVPGPYPGPDSKLEADPHPDLDSECHLEGGNEEAAVADAGEPSNTCSTTSADSVGAQQQSTQTEVRARKVIRPVFTKTQVEELKNFFEDNQYPSTMMRNDLATRMNVTEERIKTWFKNRRARLRRLGIMPSSYSCPMNQDLLATINLERKHSASFLQKPSDTCIMTDREPMPSPSAPVVPPYSPVLPTAAAPPLYPFPPPACPRPAPPFYFPPNYPPPFCPPTYPPPFNPPPPAPPICFPASAPARQPQSDVRMTSLPVDSNPVLPRCPSLIGAPWFAYFNRP